MGLKGKYSCLFLDRDGVINRHPANHYVLSWNEFFFLPGVLESLVKLKNTFDHIVVITNQQGIGKGLMTEDDLQIIHDNMSRAIKAFGGKLDMICYCADLAEKEDNCRKPSPKMGHQAKAALPDIDFSRSIMAGDQLSDLEFGKRLGMTSVLISNKESPVSLTDDLGKIPVYNSLLEFASGHF